MRILGAGRAGALICLCLFFDAAITGLVHPGRRAEPSLSGETSPRETLTGGGEAVLITSPADSSASTTASKVTPKSSVHPQTTNIINSTLFNTEIGEDHLPLEPQITPGFAVAGVILVCTGVIYAVVGIKTRWIHSFLSSAFLGSLGTSVLIVYVMTPPVSKAIQGAYVVAVACTGLVLGGLAIVFKEITECLACLLGGFCLSMWLLTLQPGGLIQQADGKVGFIAAFTLAAFGLYFTPWTRTYGMIACISFSGATVAVLGLDCFSRAGYKEFWAYLWALNDGLFPLGTNTYPLTRGIRVEIAVTVLIFLAGVVSQLKLWRIIKDRRSKRDAERAEGERARRAEEESAGRQIEETTARERRRWERVYGDGANSPSGDSGVGDLESEKRLRHSSVTSAAVLTASRSQSPAGTEVWAAGTDLSLGQAMAPSSPPRLIAAEKVISKDDGTGVTVMVAQDDTPPDLTVFQEIGRHENKTTEITDGGDMKSEHSIPTAWTGNNPLNPKMSPSITPLPFTVPEERAETEGEEDRSSIATFADQDEPEPAASRPKTAQEGLDGVVRRLSNGSAKLFRSLSQRSKKNEQGKRNAGHGESHEGLIETPHVAKDESDSVAANMDDMSDVSDLVSHHEWETSEQVDRDVNPDVMGKGLGGGAVGDAGAEEMPQTDPSPADRPPLSAKISCDEVASLPDAADVPIPPSESAPRGVEEGEGKPDDTALEQARSAQNGEDMFRRASVDSVAASLTKGNLPGALSRVAMAYRTNEWAKHLSAAETPVSEPLQVDDDLAEDAFSDCASEGPVPVDVAELQQTAENAIPAPAAPRSASAMSTYGAQNTVMRSSSRTSLGGYSDAPVHSSEHQARFKTQPYRSSSGMLKGKVSGLLAQPIAEEGDGDAVRNISPVQEESPNLLGSRYTTPSPGPRESTSTPNLSAWPQAAQTQSGPQTLMGIREMLLRTKASAGLLTTPTPDAIYSNSHPPAASAVLAPPDQARTRPPSNSEAGSIHNSPFNPSSPIPPEADDIPLSARRDMIRQSSLNSLDFTGTLTAATTSSKPHRSQSRGSLQGGGLYSNSNSNKSAAEATRFDSHQPSRGSNVQNEAVRQAQLANFRSSVAADLRASSPIDGVGGSPGAVATWESSSAMGGGSGLVPAASIGSLRGAAYASSPVPGNMLNPGYGSTYGTGRDSALGMGMAAAQQEQKNNNRTMERQRSLMLGQKEAEMAKREAERLEAEKSQREWEERVRSSGALMEAHRDALRRMQARARD